MKKFRLILIVLLGTVLLTGCYCCPTCPPVSQSCYLTISTGDYIWADLNKNVWGEIYINGQPTGQEIHYAISSLKKVTVSVPCNQMVSVYIVDPCGEQSHTETIYISPGSNNLYFAYW